MNVAFPVSLDEFYVVLKRDMCFGECPVYQLKIYGSGLVEYLGIQYVKNEGKHSKTISQGKILKLFQQIFELGILKLDSDYNGINNYIVKDNSIDCSNAIWSDSSLKCVEIKIGRKVKKYVIIEEPQKRLKQFEALIDHICSVNNWIRAKR